MALFLATVPDEMFVELDDDIELIVEVFHNAFGEYPSYLRRRYRGLGPLPRGLVAFSGLFDGGLDNPRIASVAPLQEIDGEWFADSGLECFCEYEEMLFFLGADDADTAAALMNLPSVSTGDSDLRQFIRDNRAVLAARTVTQVNADAAMALVVTAAEGELVNEPVTLTPYP